jgi:hypothetical protein
MRNLLLDAGALVVMLVEMALCGAVVLVLLMAALAR